MRWFFTENEANSSLTTDLTACGTPDQAFNTFYGCIGRVTVTFHDYAGDMRNRKDLAFQGRVGRSGPIRSPETSGDIRCWKV